jgi:hypothetical protein
MLSITDLAGKKLQWVFISSTMRRIFACPSKGVLRYIDDDIASIDFSKSFFSLKSIAKSAEGSWIFDRDMYDWFNSDIKIQSDDKTYILQRKNFYKSILEIPDGRKYFITSFIVDPSLPCNYQFETITGETLITYEDTSTYFSKERFAVTVHPKAVEVPELPWMVMLGLYHIWVIDIERHNGVI